MFKISNYNIFLFLSTLVRNLIDVFSCVLLYKMGYTLTDILLFMLIMSIIGLIVDYFCLKIHYKICLIISAILYGGSFYFLSVMDANIVNLIIFAVILAISNYSYTLVRHLLALNLVENSKDNISIIMVFIYLATIFSSLVGSYLLENLSLGVTALIVIFLSLFSIKTISGLDKKISKLKMEKVVISKKKLLFSIFSQFKVIFITLQPLYLYLYVNDNVYYIGIFNVVINIASLIVMYFISKKVNNKYFKCLNIILCVALFLKLNVRSSLLILGVAFLEGIGQKIYEIVSLENLYDKVGNINSYLMMEEVFFCLGRSLIIGIFYLLVKDLMMILYICIIGIFISGFFIEEI